MSNVQRKRQYKDSTDWMKWYHNLSSDEKKQHNHERYIKYKARYNANSAKWAKGNPEQLQASSHNKQVRNKYPNAVVEDSPSNKDLTKYLLDHKDVRCRYCGNPADSIDHVTPLSKGGLHIWSNIQLLCNWCNISKNGRTVEEFETWIRQLGNYSV